MRCVFLATLGALSLTSALGAGAQSLTFARDDYPSAAGARGIVTADFDRNGLPDVAHVNLGWNSVTVLLNRPGSGLTRMIDTPVGIGPFALTSGDFNRDGIVDLAVANADGSSISVLLGKGDGRFTRSDIAAPGQNPRGITAADVNNDGKLDLIYTGYATGTVQVLVGNGAGGFTKGLVYTGFAPYPQGIGAADFNHDGWMDLAVAYTGDNGLRILYGNGGTAFTPRTIAGDTYLNVLTIGDFNLDGWMDVAAASTRTSRIALYLGGPAGLVHTVTYDTGASPRDIAAGDLDGDGLPDLITADRRSSTVSVLRGDRAHPGAFLGPVEVAAGNGSRAVAVADFDADGRLDLATGNEYVSRVTVLSNRTVLTRAAVGATADSISVLRTRAAAVPLPVRGGVRGFAGDDFNADGGPRSYRDTLTARDGSGASASDGVAVAIAPIKEIVLWMDRASTAGRWQNIADASAAGGHRAYDPNLRAPKVMTSLPDPSSYVTVNFIADPTQTYKLWLRLKADHDNWANDSVWVQFSGSADVTGAPKYRIGTTSGLSVSLEECVDCGVSGWGWQDDAWGAYNKNGVLLRFPEGGEQQILLQTREDGVSIDQIVLSARKYLTTRPGAAKKDTTILAATYPR